ncbi:MAG: hypothetical protein WA672_14715 [Candidatus Angelobacter sp.]
MKLNNTYLVVDSGGTGSSPDWNQAHALISKVITSMRWPDKKGINGFAIPRIVSIKVGDAYTNETGRIMRVRGKVKTLRNGVRPLRDQFRRLMADENCKAEEPLSLAPFFLRLREKTSVEFPKYPRTELKEKVEFNESVGNFDFWFETKTGFKTVVEWETGNISSSHRSLNKMCLALMGGLVDAAVLIVPSRKLYVHLTDRIGNIHELQPYFYYWTQFGRLIEKGLLAIIEVEHDSLFQSKDLRQFVPTGSDGNSPRGSRKKR